MRIWRLSPVVGRTIAPVPFAEPMNSHRRRHLSSFAGQPIQTTATPWRIIIGVLLGYVPRHRWIAKALDDGLRLAAIAERIKIGGIFRRRAKFIGTAFSPTASAL